METDKLHAISATNASVMGTANEADFLNPKGVYTFQCFDADGNLKWEDTIKNLVTTAGKNDMEDKYFAGSAYTAAFYMGLVSSVNYTTGVSATDIMATHPGWTEAGATNAPTYSQGARPTCAWSAASAGAKALSASLAFSITSSGTIKGSFITTVATKDGTTGVLFSGGTFTGGDKIVANTDSVTVSYSISM